MQVSPHNDSAVQKIGKYSYDEFVSVVQSFHGYAAPGVLMGGFMVQMAMERMPEGVLYDAVSETTNCLPDAIQLLTPCTIGNGWMRVLNLGRYALCLYDKTNGNGVRVYVDSRKTVHYPAVHTWFLKLKPKREQDTDLLLSQIREAGFGIYGIEPVTLREHLLQRRHKGAIAICSICGEAYPADHGRICRVCQGQNPYIELPHGIPTPELKAVSVEEAIGKPIVHDMTEIIPGKSKGPAFQKGHVLDAGDLCRLHQMGKEQVYVTDETAIGSGWVHENEAALAFAKAMSGERIGRSDPPREGKINLFAAEDGLLVVADDILERFNRIEGVMCASRKSYSVLQKGQVFAGTRAIPLYLPRTTFERAMQVLDEKPIFSIHPMRQAKVGILVTGTEVFRGLVEDKFIPIIRAKVEAYGCSVVRTDIVPDDRNAISEGIQAILQAGADLLVTTAGLSVDPDDVTRQGLLDAGASGMLYGSAILPGAMTLLARIGNVQVIGVPACALYFKITSFDLLLPRLLANVPIQREHLAKMGHGAFCMECKTCTFPKCPFGK
ncbi:FmdE family protein [Desulfatirhabdium butyrativorans]|uniref:FmdE family protein n=1 Tax=Desulfatirhabdium butyrativorans TaxID=340467 RepID=UPI0003FE5BD5|nr:FmdE family protein [Desulfatirhabdium butyrativorans]